VTYISAYPVTPAQSANKSRENNTHEEDTLQVVLVLPDDNGVLVQIGNVGAADTLGVLLHHHPSEMRVEQALANRVGVLVGISVAVVATMSSTPPTSTALHSASASSNEEDSERKLRLVCSMRPKTVVSCAEDVSKFELNYWILTQETTNQL
jgi:hypothetical protein